MPKLILAIASMMVDSKKISVATRNYVQMFQRNEYSIGEGGHNLWIDQHEKKGNH